MVGEFTWDLQALQTCEAAEATPSEDPRRRVRKREKSIRKKFLKRVQWWGNGQTVRLLEAVEALGHAELSHIKSHATHDEARHAGSDSGLINVPHKVLVAIPPCIRLVLKSYARLLSRRNAAMPPPPPPP